MMVRFCTIAALGVFAFASARSYATVLTLNLVPANSSVTLSGTFATPFGALPFSAQDGQAGTTDLVAGSPSTRTTFQGAITVDVDDLFAPTSIKFVSSSANADLSGQWLSQVQPVQDLDGDGTCCEFGDDSSTTTGTTATPAADADWGIRVPQITAWAAYRDIVYNITTPAALAVNGAGQFSSTQNFEFGTGWLDYWISPATGNLRGRAELAGGDDDNSHATASTYIVTPLGGGLSQVTLTIPIHIDDMGSDLHTFYDGQFQATVVIPEPASILLVGIAGIAALAVRRRS